METINAVIRILGIAVLSAGVLLGIYAAVRVVRQRKDLDRLIMLISVVCISAYTLLVIGTMWAWALGLAVVSLLLSIGFVIYSLVTRRPLHIIFTLFCTLIWLVLIFCSASGLLG